MQLFILRFCIGFALFLTFVCISKTTDNHFMGIMLWWLAWGLLDLYANNSQTLELKKGDRVEILSKGVKVDIEAREEDFTIQKIFVTKK